MAKVHADRSHAGYICLGSAAGEGIGDDPVPEESHAPLCGFPVPGTSDRDEEPVTGGVGTEGTCPGAIRGTLAGRGDRVAAPARRIGGSQASWVDWDEGVLTGGSDPRKDGCAIGY